MKLAIIIVNWNVSGLLRKCLQSILVDGAAPRGTHVVVVDSASIDDSVAMIRAEFPNVQLIGNERNVGFTAGNNQGLAAVGAINSGARHLRKCRAPCPEYILLLNPDTEIVGAALIKMVNYMDAHPEVGALGPQLLNSDGSIQSSRRRFPTLRTAFMESTILQQWFPNNQILRNYYIADTSDDEIQEVDWVVGACVLARGAVVATVGSLDEHFFMYSEELDWCYRIKRQGWRIVYLPTAQIIHHSGKSSEQVVAAKHIHFQSSKVYFFRKHFGAFWGEVLRAFLLGTYLYQVLEESTKWLVGHKRAMRAARMGAYWQVLRSGLRRESTKAHEDTRRESTKAHEGTRRESTKTHEDTRRESTKTHEDTRRESTKAHEGTRRHTKGSWL